MKTKAGFLLNLIVVLTMLLSAWPISVFAAPAMADPPPPLVRERPSVDLVRAEEGVVSPNAALEKIAPGLRESAQAGGKELVSVTVEVADGTDLSAYFSDYMARAAVFRGNRTVHGKVQANDLLVLASMAEVNAILSYETYYEQMVVDSSYASDREVDEAALQARLAELRAIDVPYDEAPDRAVNAEGWWDVRDGHKSSDAWAKGFSGEGVLVAVLDDGIDMGHPDLVGTAGRVMDPASPYYGWPWAYNDAAMDAWAEQAYGGNPWVTLGGYGVWYADTSEAHRIYGPTGGTAIVEYTPLAGYNTWSEEHEYIVPLTSQSNEAHIGSFPDVKLQNLYGERVAVLVMDEGRRGVYDTVYVDLDNDYDFTDEKPAFRGDEYIYRDMDGDGYADLSGGMVQWISDGVNPLPISDWMWGLGVVGNGVQDFGEPDAGDLVMFSGAYDSNSNHGTLCATHISAQGVIAGGLSAPSFAVGGVAQGAAPDAGLVNFGNHYRSAAPMFEYMVAAWGYDGLPYSGDEIQITTNSYGESLAFFANWSFYDRYITDLNMSSGANTAFVFSYGNDGAGFSTNEGEAGVTAIKVSSSSQYGSTNWDSIASADQIVYGDVTGFASNGPDFDGNIAPDILANGGRGAGLDPVNDILDGWTAWETWGGTSRSGPVAGGNLALIYQAYMARHGVWPTYQEAKELLMAGGNDAKADPTLQGAGVLNADRSTDLAAGIYGVYATPAKWDAGGYRGTDYESFAHMVSPGDTVAQIFTVHNPSGYDITVDLSDGKLKQISGTVTIPWTSSDLGEESGFNFHSPDYLIPIDDTLIPANTDLMVVRFVQELEMFDPDGDYVSENHWRHIVYNWTDNNGDGDLWVDADGNGVVNHEDDVAAGTDNDGFFQIDYSDPGTEIQQGEYIRLDYNFSGNTEQLTIRDPLDRMGTGLFIGLQHRLSTDDLPVSGMTFYLEFYERVDWPLLSLSDTSLTVKAWDTETFTATMTVPTNTPYGFYDGHILIADPGDSRHDEHTTFIPVGVDVAAELDDSVIFGGGDATDQMYDNNVVRGLGSWHGGWESINGEWRHFFMDVPTTTLKDNSYLIVHSDWAGDAPTEDWPLGTDIETYILGPYNDGFGWQFDGTADPVFGPYGLEVLGTSRVDMRGGGLWAFSTWTDDTEDWAAVPLAQEGLYEIGLHNGLFDGTAPEVPFELNVGIVDVGATVAPSGTVTLNSVDADAYTNTGQVNVWFTSTIDLPNLNAALSGGLVDTTHGPWSVWVPDTGACYSAWCAGTAYEYFWVPPNQTMLEVYVYAYGLDPDLFLVYDTNGNGLPEQGIDQVLLADGGGSGANTDEQVFWANPASGGYFAAIDGYDTGGGAWLDWQYTLTAVQPLPTRNVPLFSGAFAGAQDSPFDPLDASFRRQITMTERVAALYVDLSYAATLQMVDFDLYLVDENDEIVASSTSTGMNESIVFKPTPPDYRFEEGAKYTILVHGQNLKVGTVVLPEAWFDLDVSWDVLNMWLEKPAAHSDVHPSAISAGEAVSVTVNFDDDTMMQDADCVQGYLTVGPDDYALFYEKVNACYVSPPVAPTPFVDAIVRKTNTSARGNVYDQDYTALGNAWELVTYTVQITNTGTTTGTFRVEDQWHPDEFLFEGFVVAPTNYDWYDEPGFRYDEPDWRVLYITATLKAGEGLMFSYVNRTSADMELNDYYYNYVDVYEYDPNLLPDEYWWSGWWYDYDWARVYARRAYYGLDIYKMADPYGVYPGDLVTFTIDMVNVSAEDTPIFVSDGPLDPALNFVSATNGATYDAEERRVTWSGEILGSEDGITTFDIQATVADTATVGSISNCAYLYRKLDGNIEDSYCTSIYVQPSANLSVIKTVDSIGGFPEDGLTYSIVMYNSGPLATTNAVMADVIPSYVTVVSNSLMIDKGSGTLALPEGDFDAETGLLQWEGDLAASDTYTITFQATIDEDAPEGWAIINLAEFTADNANMAYNSALTEVYPTFSIYLPIITKN